MGAHTLFVNRRDFRAGRYVIPFIREILTPFWGTLPEGIPVFSENASCFSRK